MRKDEEGLYLENVKTGKDYEFVLRGKSQKKVLRSRARSGKE